jgi:hypothetical protein
LPCCGFVSSAAVIIADFKAAGCDCGSKIVASASKMLSCNTPRAAAAAVRVLGQRAAQALLLLIVLTEVTRYDASLKCVV